MKSFYTSKKTGFTLIELIVSIAISSIIIIVLFSALNTSMNTYKALSEFSRGYNEYEFALNYISDEVGAASSITSSVDNDEIIISIDRGENVNSDNRFQNISYRQKLDSIYRYSITSSKKYTTSFSKYQNIGINRLVSGIESFSIDLEKGVVTIEITSTSGPKYKKIVAVRCRDET